MTVHNAAVLHGRRRSRREIRQSHDKYDPFHRRRILAIGCEISTMTRVPTLNWPVDLFVDARAPEAESTT
jgi:hypothetical protein